MTLEIDYSGWFQCRLATDPDEFDHKRGEAGWTFAMPGEPDLDRLIRFHGPVAPRSHGPAVGVYVTAVRMDGADVAATPLTGAPLYLLDCPVFEGRNGEIAPSAQEPIVPFALSIALRGAAITGRDPIDLADPTEITRRQPIGFIPNSPVVAAATGILDRAQYRQDRRARLQAELAAETDPTRRRAIEQRIAQLALGSIRLTSLGFQLNYAFDLRGPNTWIDDAGVLGVPTPAAGAVWSVRFWAGGWDADALCGYTLGTLRIG